MAVLTSEANSVTELLQGIVTFLTDPLEFGTGNEWKLMRPAIPGNITDEAILQGVGDGHDTIYIGFKIKSGIGPQQIDLVLNGFAGFDAGLTWEEQPGGIYHAKLPVLALVSDTLLSYWISANTSRVLLIVKLSSQYESGYLGFMKTIAIERQYPYPLVIGGSYIEGGDWTRTSPGHSAFTNPGSDTYDGSPLYGGVYKDDPLQYTTSLRLRRPDGSWRAAQNKNRLDVANPFEKLCVWPTNTKPVNTLTVYDSIETIENVIMYPFILYESIPVGMLGQLDGVFWVGNRKDLSSEDSIVYNNKIYKVFNNVFRRDNDEYFAIEWA
jgi:hypothetical protein